MSRTFANYEGEGVPFRRGKGGLNQTDDGAKGDRPTNGAARRKGFRRKKNAQGDSCDQGSKTYRMANALRIV